VSPSLLRVGAGFAGFFCNSTIKIDSSAAGETQKIQMADNMPGTEAWGQTMNRAVIWAISVLTLTASQPLFAAESETAVPRERAVPAAERAAPAARRAQPAREQRAAPQQQATQSQASQTSSYTGTQAGGFGGGNAGGGGFADPICLSSLGGLSGCTPVAFNHSLSKTGGIGGGVLQWTIPVSQWVVVGILGDLSFGKTTASASQSFLYASDPSITNQLTAETYTSSVSQSTSGSLRFKAGLVTPLPGWYGSIMPYITVGWIRSKFDGAFTYNALNYNAFPCTCSPPPTFAGTSVSWSHQTNGIIYGFGVDIPIPAVGPGIVLVFDYSRADFQSFDVTVPVTAAPCIVGTGKVCATTDTLHVSNPSSNRFTAGLRIKLL
jgi:hypothetical protein